MTTLSCDNVVSVYSGVRGQRCCGFKGTHSYNPKFKELTRSYHRISQRSVTYVVNKLNEQGEDVHRLDGMVWAEVGNRIYVAYLVTTYLTEGYYAEKA